jgi:membrane protease YdiL (CAAX protease family)
MTTSSLRRAVAAHQVPQYTRGGVLAVWAAAAVPMGLLSWVGAPRLADRLEGPAPLAQALLLLMTAGLVWQFVLVAVLVGRERRTGAVAGVRDALWLRGPTDERTGRRLPRAWWWLLPLLAGTALFQLVPSVPVPAGRDLGVLLSGPEGEALFRGAWGWFAVVVVLAVLNTVLGEELLFRGFLLPRMQAAFGRNDWVANGVLFALYHVHQPWSMPSALADTVLLALPSRRFRSAWFGIAVHSAQSVLVIGLTLAVVLS